MENKKTFGAFILQRRRELGMTQKEFARRLYVTESAVSKWERGMSYPDITLLQNICAELDVSESELLNGSEDTQRRGAEKLAEKYLRLLRNCRVAQYILYGAILLGCAVGNLAGRHTLDWFFIVLGFVLTAGSLTLVPALAAASPGAEEYKAPLAAGCFTAALELLLLALCLYTGGRWFAVTGTAVLFCLSLVLLPFLLSRLPLPACLAGKRASLYLLTETGLLLLLLLVCCLRMGGDWFPAAAAGVLFGLGFFLLPVILRQCVTAPPLCRHKTLLYFTIQTILLLTLTVLWGVTSAPGWLEAGLLPVCLCLLLPWGLMGAIRYLPVNGWFRGAACSAWSGLWLWLSPVVLDRVMAGRYVVYLNPDPYPLWIPFDFSVWEGGQAGYNVIAILLFSLAFITVLLAAAGLARRR